MSEKTEYRSVNSIIYEVLVEKDFTNDGSEILCPVFTSNPIEDSFKYFGSENG